MVISSMRDQPKSCPEAAILLVSTKVDVSDESSGNWIGFPDLSNNFQNIQCPMLKTVLNFIGLQYLIRHACLVCLYVKSFLLLKELTDPK